jgi:hypothetical protein
MIGAPSRKSLAVAASTLLLASLLACSKAPRNAAARVEAAAKAREAAMQKERTDSAAMDADRQELDSIPLPSKNEYMVIHTRASWQNPFLVVTKSTVSLTMLYPDMGPAHAPGDSLLRPEAARRERLELRLSELPRALTALPPNVWPYGRVVAVEDDPTAPKQDKPQVRRNEEAALQILSNLGVVAYEWPNGH